MKKTMKYLFPVMMLAIVATGLLSHTAKAQVDSGTKTYLFENGVRVGEIYTDHVAGQTQYVEDWVLYPNYLYPGPHFNGVLQVIASPTEAPYTSEADFFHNVPFTAGSKYIRVSAEEYASLPSRR